VLDNGQLSYRFADADSASQIFPLVLPALTVGNSMLSKTYTVATRRENL
jgi:hypothetical protein